VFSSAAQFNGFSNVITLRFSNEIIRAGANGACWGRLYQNSVPSAVGAVQVGAQTPTFAVDNGSVAQFTFDAALVSMAYLLVALGANTAGSTNGLYMAILDDIGLTGSLSGAGCCHDPMLDLILAAVKGTYT
jgi:hypothetical protein